MMVRLYIAFAMVSALLGLPSITKGQETSSSQQHLLMTLTDKQELHELSLRYARAVDRKNFDELMGLYDLDGLHDHGGMFKGSPQDFIAWLKSSMTSIETQHLVANSLFQISGDQASGEIYTINFHHMPNLSSNYIAGGRYLDRYVKVGGKWLFKSRLRIVDWSEERPAQSGVQASSLIKGAAGSLDPSADFEGFQVNGADPYDNAQFPIQ